MKCFYLIILFVISHISVLGQKLGQKHIDSLILMLSKINLDTNNVNILNEISYSYYPIDPEKGIEYGKRGLGLSLKINWKHGIASAYRCIGVNFGYGKSDFIKSLDYYNKSLAIFTELKDLNGIAKVYNNIGAAYYEQSEYLKAIDYYFKSIKIYEEIGDKSKIANLLGNIGIVYNDRKQYDSALSYNEKSLKIYKELEDKNGVSKILGNIGNVYANNGNYNKSLEYDFLALNITKEIGIKNRVALITGNIGDVYLHQADYPKALEFFHEALRHFRDLGDKKSVAINLGNIGETYLLVYKDSIKNKSTINLNNNINNILIQARNYLDSSILINKEINYLNGLAEKYAQISEVNELLGNNIEALSNYKNYNLLKDSIFSIEKEKKINQIVSSYQNEMIEKDRKLNEKLQKQKVLIQIVGVCVFIILLIGFLIVISKRKVSFQFIKILSVFSILLIFEFFTLLLHKGIELITNHDILMTLICLVIVASVIIPVHHKVEEWFIDKLKGRINYKKNSVSIPKKQSN